MLDVFHRRSVVSSGREKSLPPTLTLTNSLKTSSAVCIPWHPRVHCTFCLKRLKKDLRQFMKATPQALNHLGDRYQPSDVDGSLLATRHLALQDKTTAQSQERDTRLSLFPLFLVTGSQVTVK